MAACAAPGPTNRSTHSTQKHLGGVGGTRQGGGPSATHAHCIGESPRVLSSPPFHPYWATPSHCKLPHFVGSLQPHRSTPQLLPPPAAVVVAAHEHLAPTTADGAVGLVSIVVVLVRALQKAVLGMGGTESVWTPDPIAPCGAVRTPPLCTYLAVLAHSPDKQRVLQGDVEAPAGDADIWGGTQGWGGSKPEPPHPSTPSAQWDHLTSHQGSAMPMLENPKDLEMAALGGGGGGVPQRPP